MNTELFQGPPKELKDRVDAIITANPTISSLQVIPTSEKSWYLIIWS